MANGGGTDPIKHVVVLMLENRSFDQMLGCFQSLYPSLEGIPPGQPPRTNAADGVTYKQDPGAGFVAPNDPNHDFEHVRQQLANSNGGFVQDFVNCYPKSTTADRAEIMKYHARGALPALHALAESFMICDHWFASLPGPTWPNRLFVHSGTSLGRVTMPEGVLNANLHWYNQATIYDRLNEKKVPWKVYFGDIAQSWVLVDQWAPRNMINYHHMQRFYEDVAEPESQFPSYVFLEPTYYPPGADDDHPCHNLLGPKGCGPPNALHAALPPSHVRFASPPAGRVAGLRPAPARPRLDPAHRRHLREVASDGEQGRCRRPRRSKW